MTDTSEHLSEQTDWITKTRWPATWRTRASWLVLSWSPSAPRPTVCADGYYLQCAAAERVAASARTRGRVALVLELPPGSATIPIPAELYGTGREVIADMSAAQRDQGGDAAC